MGWQGGAGGPGILAALALAALTLGACGGKTREPGERVGRHVGPPLGATRPVERGEAGSIEPAPPGGFTPSLRPGGADADPGHGDPALPAVCEGYAGVGFGSTWLATPPTGAHVEPLRCLRANVPTLSGRFVGSVVESEAPWHSHGKTAEEPDRVYAYDFLDPFANHSSAYFMLTEMALEHRRLSPLADYTPLDLVTGPFFVFNSFYTGVSIVLGRDGLPGRHVDAQIAAHELGHHAVVSLASGILSSTLHEGLADFFACAFTKNPHFLVALPAGFDRPCDNDHAWPVDARDWSEVCTAQRIAFEKAGWDAWFPSWYEALVEHCDALSPPYALEGHETGRIVSGALWALTGPLGVDGVVVLLLHALHLWSGYGRDFGELRAALLAADAALHGGAYAAVLTAELDARGIVEDVGLADLEASGGAFPCLKTAAHEAAELLPAGPVLVTPRARRR